MKMKIKGEFGDYIVDWEQAGFSFADAKVYKLEDEVTFLFWKWRPKTFVWTYVGPTLLSDARTMLPKQMKFWYQQAVRQYETHTREWSEHQRS